MFGSQIECFEPSQIEYFKSSGWCFPCFLCSSYSPCSQCSINLLPVLHRNPQFVEPCSWNWLINQSISIKVDTSSAWYHLFFCAQDLKHIKIKISRIAFKVFLRMLLILSYLIYLSYLYLSYIILSYLCYLSQKGNRPFRLLCGSTSTNKMYIASPTVP